MHYFMIISALFYDYFRFKKKILKRIWCTVLKQANKKFPVNYIYMVRPHNFQKANWYKYSYKSIRFQQILYHTTAGVV